MSKVLPPEKMALSRAAKVLGGWSEMASLLGYKDRRGAWIFLEPDRRFPSDHCPIVERATREKGQPVLCEELRPDVAWEVVRNSPLAESTAPAQPQA